MKLVVLIAAGEVNFYSSISSSLRSLEEVSVGGVKLLHTRAAVESARALSKLLPNAEVLEIPGDETPLNERLSRMRALIEPSDVAVISPAGASLSAVASKVTNKLLHVTFPFGLWNGLVYPFVPRFLQRLSGVNVSFNRKVNEVIRGVSLEGVGLGEIGPIRREVALLTKRLNSLWKGACNDWGCEKPSRIEVSVEAGPMSLFEIKTTPEETAVTFTGTRNSILAQGQDSLLWLSGLLPLEVKGEVRDKPLIADTSFVLLGALNWVYRGRLVRVPRCVIYELIHKFEERAKRGGKVDLIALISQDLVKEIKALKIEYPSPPDLCDKAMMQMDPLLMDGNVLVTEDRNFYNVWTSLPLKKLMDAALIDRPGKRKPYIEVRERELRYADRVYSTLQFYALVKRALRNLKDVDENPPNLRAEVRLNGELLEEFSSHDSDS